MKKYEIYNLTTKEILVDNLDFEDVPELFLAYMEFYPENEIIVVFKEIKKTTAFAKIVDANEVKRKEFYSEWFSLMDELIFYGNIY